MRFNLNENAKTCILYIQKGEKIKRKKSILKGNPKAKEADFMITKFVIKDAGRQVYFHRLFGGRGLQTDHGKKFRMQLKAEIGRAHV